MAARSEALQVFLRVRPPIFKEVKQENAVQVRGAQTLTLMDDKKETTCSYDYVFNEVSEQQQVFEMVKPLLEDVLSGVNACIFAYGQTSAGKSYTMIGPNGGQDIFRRDADEWGILPRASEYLLGYLNDRAMEGLLSYEVKASFLQIYNENLYDLLRDTGPMIDDKMAQTSGGSDKESDLRIREVPKRKGKDGNAASEVFVSGLSEFRVQTAEDILRILAVGANNRMTRSTDFNATSSRSHALLQLTFEIEAQTETGQRVISRSKLNLVDLAGSEKIPFAVSEYNNAKHMKELTSINKSLSSLGNVIAALSSNNRTHIPYRDSKLTRILQDSLSGNTRTILVACVAPTVLHAAETLSTLQFADRAKNVMLSVKANTVVDDKFLLTKAHGEITRLKTLLAHALKQLDQKGKGDGGADAMELMRLQEENDILRRDNAQLKKTQHLPQLQQGRSPSPSPHEIQLQQQQQQFQQQQQYQAQQAQSLHLPQIQQSQPYLNYSATNPNMAPTHANSFQPIQQNGANGMYNMNNMGNMSVDSLLNGNKLAKNWEGAGRFSLDHEPKEKKKKAKVRSVPPLFDLIESARSLTKKGGKKESMQSASKIHAKVYKSANDRQIDELNAMLSGANHQANLQQQQNMAQYLQQQQFLQQNFPHQQLTMPGQQQQQQQQPLYPQPMQVQQASYQPPPQQQHQQSPAMAAFSPMPIHPSPMMNTLNTFAASITQPHSYNTSHAAPAVHRPAPVHLGAPSYPVPSAEVYETTNDPEFLRQEVPSAAPSPVTVPTKPKSPAIVHAPPAVVEPVLRTVPEKEPEEPSPTVLESSREPAQESARGGSPKAHSHRKHKNKDRHRDKSREREGGESTSRTNSDDTNHHSSAHEPSTMLTGRSSMDAGVLESARLGTGHSGGTPSTSGTMGARMPNNRIVRKGQQQPGGAAAAESHDLHAANVLATGMAVAHSQHAFMASLLNKQAQQGPPAALMMQQQPPASQGASDGASLQRAANLSQSSEDIGRAVQLFSFRMNTWDRIDLIDYDSVKRLHKCRHPDGSVQWLDLTKKPVRVI